MVNLIDFVDRDIDGYWVSDKFMDYILSSGTGGYYYKPEIDLELARPLTSTMHKSHRCSQDTYLSERYIKEGIKMSVEEIKIRTANRQGWDKAEEEEDSINLAYPESETRRGRVGHGVAQTLDTQCNQGVFVKRVDIPQTVRVRKYEVDEEALVELLRRCKESSGKSNAAIAEELGIQQTMVDHWFRKDEHFSIPTPECWLGLKECIGIDTDEFDESIMTFEEREGVFDKSERHYMDDGIAPTLTTHSNAEKIIESPHGTYKGYRIRRLTPKECFRLQGWTDEYFERARPFNSDTQLYKQAGNGVTCTVIHAIAKRMEELDSEFNGK